MKYKHLFGPVNSRRLGLSLGVDLVPYKFCPLNCVYCEIQSTTNLQTERQEFFDVDEILAELDHFMLSKPKLDYITFSGAGEPTLNLNIGRVIEYVKTKYPEYKLALLTNGVLLNDDNLIKEILPCDLILPSLDAASQKVYEEVNRPIKGLKVQDHIQGLIRLRRQYKGLIHLEVFIVPDITDTLEELKGLREIIAKISPDLVQLNSLDRPGTEEWVEAAKAESLLKIKTFMEEELKMPVEIIAKIDYQSGVQVLDEDLVDSIKGIILRRPSTAEDLAKNLNIHINEISKALRELNLAGKLKTERRERGVFYTWIA